MRDLLRCFVPCAAWFALGMAVAHRPCEVQSAPAPRTADIVGEYKTGSLDSPMVVLVRDDEPHDYWLVFLDPAVEVQARKCEAGQRVKVTGKPGAGGGYRYIVVAAIAADE